MKFYPRKKDREANKRSTIVDLWAEEIEEKELKKKNEKKTFNSKK